MYLASTATKKTVSDSYSQPQKDDESVSAEENSSSVIRQADSDESNQLLAPAGAITIDGMLVDEEYFSMADASNTYSHHTTTKPESVTEAGLAEDDESGYIQIRKQSSVKNRAAAMSEEAESVQRESSRLDQIEEEEAALLGQQQSLSAHLRARD